MPSRTCWAVSALGPCIDGPIDCLGNAGISELQVGRLVMVMVGTAPVERIIQSEGDLPIRPWILVWGELSGWLQGLMVSMPALRQQYFIASTPLHVALLQYNPHAGA